MASLVVNIISNDVSCFMESNDKNVALIHCKLEKIPSAFSKMIAHFSLNAKWQMMYLNKNIALNKDVVQVGYQSDTRDIDYKNSALVLNSAAPLVVMPMIWTSLNNNDVYQAIYIAFSSLVISFDYFIAFEITSDLPIGLLNAHPGKHELTVNTAVSSAVYSVTISIT